MNHRFGNDLTTGSIPKHLIQFALPILIGNLLSTGYSIINTIWVGNLLGKEAVAAVAVSFPIFLGLIALCSGATLATSILISKAYGAKDYDAIQRIVNNSWAIAIIMIIFIIAGGFFLSDPILNLLGTPSEIMPLASKYMKIVVISFIFIYVSYLVASILRGIGNTVIPLAFVIISTVMNAMLDPLLIIGLGPFPRLGLNGAAYASLISCTFSTILGLIYVKWKYKMQPINPSGIALDGKIVKEIVLIGIPSFIQQMLVSMGYAFITSFVNGFGAAATAAFGITSRIDSVIAMPAIAMMMSASTLTAQNLGAGKQERIKDIFRWGILVNLPVIFIISMLCFNFPETIMNIFVKDESVIDIGVEYLRIVGLGYLCFAVFYISNGIINGAGKTISTMIISFFTLCLVRIPLAAFLSGTSMGLRGIWYAIVISFVVSTVSSLTYYFFGKWNQSNVNEKIPDQVQLNIEN